MKHDDLPERWKKKIVEYLRNSGESKREKLGASNFSQNQILHIKFEDESYAEFRYPLLINAPEFNEVGVFTEHCGYHIFNMNGTYINKKNLLDD